MCLVLDRHSPRSMVNDGHGCSLRSARFKKHRKRKGPTGRMLLAPESRSSSVFAKCFVPSKIRYRGILLAARVGYERQGAISRAFGPCPPSFLWLLSWRTVVIHIAQMGRSPRGNVLDSHRVHFCARLCVAFWTCSSRYSQRCRACHSQRSVTRFGSTRRLLALA
jgi:hypothetical protein